EKAADYIAKQFRQLGLKPGNGKGYFQKFAVTANARLGESNEFTYALDGAEHELKLRRDFVPFNFSSRGVYSGQVVFAGYGITAAEYSYDDYTHLDVKDKFALLLRHEPQEFDEESVFAGKVYTEHGQFFSKAVNAKMHGARGVILVNDTGNHGGNDGELQKFQGTVGPNNAGIPFVHLDAGVAREWIKAAGKDLGDVQKEIDEDLEPRSFPLPDSLTVTLHSDVRRDIRTVRNVVGYLPGETDEFVIVGAHYDHLGLGEQFSMAPSKA
ncbi:MAG: hypothetical protein GY953_34355, partial [bacterium]|nr:hypothetical protein [bacterium]